MMTKRRSLLALAACLACAAGPARAQVGGPNLGGGERVRLEVAQTDGSTGVTKTGFIDGRFVTIDSAGVLLLRPRQSLHVPRAMIRRVQVWRGTGRASLTGMAVGAIAGGLLGSLAGWMGGSLFGTSSPSEIREAVAIGCAAGAASAGLLGLAIGSVVPQDRWREATLPQASTAAASTQAD